MGEPALDPGARVEVRSRFDQRWVRGFEVADVAASDTNVAYRVRRLSDGEVLPGAFSPEELRRERHRRDYWWQ